MVLTLHCRSRWRQTQSWSTQGQWKVIASKAVQSCKTNWTRTGSKGVYILRCRHSCSLSKDRGGYFTITRRVPILTFKILRVYALWLHGPHDLAGPFLFIITQDYRLTQKPLPQTSAAAIPEKQSSGVFDCFESDPFVIVHLLELVTMEALPMRRAWEMELVSRRRNWKWIKSTTDGYQRSPSFLLHCLPLIEAWNIEIQAMPPDAISEILSAGAQGINNQEEV